MRKMLAIAASVLALFVPAVALGAGAVLHHPPAQSPPTVLHAQPAAGAAGTFYNPVADIVDPDIVTDGGYYYLLGTGGGNRLTVKKSSTIAGLNSAAPITVWTGPSSGLGSDHLWSPVLEKVQGTWYIYLSVTDNLSTVSRAAVYALQSSTADPLGPYTLKNSMKQWSSSDGGAWERGIVGPAVTAMPNGSLYLSTTTFGFYIQKMSNPWTLEAGSSMVQIAKGDVNDPHLAWEGGTSEIARPIVHTSGASTAVVVPYTSENHVAQRTNGGPCWSFCIGSYTNTDGNLTNPASWVKASQPVFSGGPTSGDFRILALGAFKSPDGTQDWLVYNGNDTPGTNFTQRYTYVQPFSWNSSNVPVFGTPTRVGDAIAVPSGEVSSSAPSAPGDKAVDTDFNSGTSPGWSALTGSWAPCDGGRYCATGAGENIASVGNRTMANYSVQATVTPDNAPTGSGVDVIGRMQDASHFYEFELLKDSTGARKWVIAENYAGTYTIRNSGSFDWAAGNAYTLKLDLNSANLTALISIDGRRFTQLGSVRVPDAPVFGYGAAGLRTWGGLTAHYDDVTVTTDRASNGFYAGDGWPGIVMDAGSSTEQNKEFCVQQFNEYCSGGYQLSTTTAISTAGVVDPLPASMYQTERWNNSQASTRVNDGSFHYVVPSLVPGRSYRVRLHFAEIHYTATGQRVFGVSINGTQVLANFDKVAAAGGANKAVVKEFSATANAAGDIDIAFTPGTSTSVGDHNPSVSAIEVLPDSAMIDAGGGAQGAFVADTGYQSGSVLTTSSAVSTAGVADAGPAAIYQSERYNYPSPGDFHYVVGHLAPGRSYTVKLHFAEIYYTSPGQRAFNVDINGARVLSNFDKVAAAGGGFRAIVKTFTATASSAGQVDVYFSQGTLAGADHNPTVSAVEVLD